MAYKINDLTALGRNLDPTDELELSLSGATGSRKITGQEIVNGSFNIELPQISTNGTAQFSTSSGVVYSDAKKTIFQWYDNPFLGVKQMYRYDVKNYTLFNFSYPSNPPSSLSEITIDNESVFVANLNLYFLSTYTVTFNGEFFAEINSLGGATALNFPNCKVISSPYFVANSNLFVNMPSLVWTAGTFNLGGSITYFNVPKLEFVSTMYVNNLIYFSPLSFPSLKYAAEYVQITNSNITQVDFPSLLAMGSFYAGSNPSLTTINVPSLLNIGNTGYINCNAFGTPLDQATVDMFLIRLDLGGQYNGYMNFSDICQAPSTAGYAAKNNLITKGWTVTTN